ncbi:MAG TPA: cytosine permease [Acidimicrobiales bacterium]|jgi:purine-cytosine permease-like protein|nr:cytosine permease [Acidimicrobiales bacterium]
MTITVDSPDEPGTLPAADQAFHVEQRGIDFVPLTERWATPRNIGGMWAGASVQIEYFIYGAILMTFGFTFAQALSIIVIGNLSYFLLGLCSLQGPQAGTTVFAINRASYGPNGSRGIAFFNWITQIGFEVEGLILIVGASLVLALKAGFSPGDPTKVVFVVGAVLVQGVLPFLGHATIVKTLRVLVIPFVILFAVLLGFAIPHATTHGVAQAADWQTYMEGMAFTITLAGLGWVENGNDYTRYCRPDASKKAIVGWVFAGTALPEILIMTLGAAVGTFLTDVGKASNAFLPFAHQSAIPSWFVVVFLVFCIVQLFAVNSLDMYSSGVTLQAMGVHVKRYVAVVIDCCIALVITMYAVFNSSFNSYLKDFVDVVIVWIAPWAAIFLVDWAMRRYRYSPLELQRTDRGSLYYRHGGIAWAAIVAQVVGMYAAISGLSATFDLPRWLNPVTYATRDAYGYGADFSIYLGMGVAGLVYLGLGWRSVRAQADRQDQLIAATV